MDLNFFENLPYDQIKLGALTIGNFDGIHRGHRDLIKKCMTLAKKEGLGSGLLTFDPHPKEFFSNKKFYRIYTPELNAKIAHDAGISNFIIKAFDEACSKMEAVEFLDLVFTKINFCNLIVGFDFKMGSNREAGASEISSWCENKKINFEVVDKLTDEDGDKVSSSHIKKIFEACEIEHVNELLGEDYFFEGLVIRDQGLGKKNRISDNQSKLSKKFSHKVRSLFN